MSDYRFQYVVTVKNDGGVEISPTEDDGGVERTATAIDIIDTSRKLIADLERQITMDALQQLVDLLVPAPAPTASEQVANALKERGITPES
jgi:hypothetical protein